MAKRNIGKDNELKAARLKYFLRRAKQEEGKTQEVIGEETGIGRSAVAQYANNMIALNTDIILKFAKALKIQPETIDPTMKEHLRVKGTVEAGIPVIGTMTNKLPKSTIAQLKIKAPKDFLAAIESDVIFLAGETERGYIIVDLEATMEAGISVIYRRRDKSMFFTGNLLDYREGERVIIQDDSEILELQPNKLAYIVKIHEYHSVV